MEEILRYFPELTSRQREQLSALEGLYAEWNARINVISRREMAAGEFYTRHVLHSLAIARACSFGSGARVMDIGTGGGFPAVPLAIVFPEVHFVAVDSIGKKIRVVEEVVRGAGLTNVVPVCGRAESIRERFDYVVSRAVAPAATLTGWAWDSIERGRAGSLANGMLLLKGGDLDEELVATGRRWSEFAISQWFEEDFFETKKVIYIEK
ncbi:MAG: 16S rRNA (guanine(527)-N(7))-methyltransferase RsmG [Alistipes sp.]|jgi:16S rRNA (guanine527-N7)-methyltransferase|nr:16S rRNA (guanine(527)-N(7))-methyltransferase RsmG [Alistipes sp.]